jgi:hypothetical protein
MQKNNTFSCTFEAHTDLFYPFTPPTLSRQNSGHEIYDSFQFYRGQHQAIIRQSPFFGANNKKWGKNPFRGGC